MNLPSELLSFLPTTDANSVCPSQLPSPLLPRTRAVPHLATTPSSVPFRIPLSSRKLKVVSFTLLGLIAFYFLLVRAGSSAGSSRPTHTFPKQPPIGYPIDYTSSGQLGVLRPGTNSLLVPDKPRNVLVDGLTDLGLEADRSYDLAIASSPDEYIATLRAFVRDAFPSHLQPRLMRGLDSYWNGEEGKMPPMVDSRTVWQTAKERSDQERGKWTEKNDGWRWEMMGDKEADDWVKSTFGTKRKEGEEKSLVEKGWDALGEGILRADTLRYLVLLLEGGVYSDTDTICLRPIPQWGANPILLPGQRKSLLKTPPSVIIGVEADVGMREDWHQWWPRPLQIVQWTLSSAPNHPIFLDVLRRILLASERANRWEGQRDELARQLRAEGRTEQAERVEGMRVTTMKAGEADDVWEEQEGTKRKEGEVLAGGVSVMDWTGPGVWTDGVVA